MKQGKLEQAENAFNQAIEMSDIKNDIYHKSKILLDYGQLKADQGDKVHAIKIWQDAISIAEKANNWETAAKASRQSGILLISMGENDLGEGELKRSKYFELLRYP